MSQTVPAIFHPPVFNDPFFTIAELVPFVVMGISMLILLVAVIRYARMLDVTPVTRGPRGWRILSILGTALFTAAIIWQTVGYFVTGAVVWTR